MDTMVKLSEAHRANSKGDVKNFKVSAYKITPNLNISDSSEMVSTINLLFALEW